MESQFEIRSNAKHSDLCDLLERDDLSATDRQHYSLVYGINRRALLSTLSFFDVASGSLVPDIMHDVLEGALPREVKLMLQVSVSLYYTCIIVYVQSCTVHVQVCCVALPCFVVCCLLSFFPSASHTVMYGSVQWL